MMYEGAFEDLIDCPGRKSKGGESSDVISFDLPNREAQHRYTLHLSPLIYLVQKSYAIFRAKVLPQSQQLRHALRSTASAALVSDLTLSMSICEKSACMP